MNVGVIRIMGEIITVTTLKNLNVEINQIFVIRRQQRDAVSHFFIILF